MPGWNASESKYTQAEIEKFPFPMLTFVVGVVFSIWLLELVKFAALFFLPATGAMLLVGLKSLVPFESFLISVPLSSSFQYETNPSVNVPAVSISKKLMFLDKVSKVRF